MRVQISTNHNGSGTISTANRLHEHWHKDNSLIKHRHVAVRGGGIRSLKLPATTGGSRLAKGRIRSACECRVRTCFCYLIVSAWFLPQPQSLLGLSMTLNDSNEPEVAGVFFFSGESWRNPLRNQFSQPVNLRTYNLEIGSNKGASVYSSVV